PRLRHQASAPGGQDVERGYEDRNHHDVGTGDIGLMNSLAYVEDGSSHSQGNHRRENHWGGWPNPYRGGEQQRDEYGAHDQRCRIRIYTEDTLVVLLTLPLGLGFLVSVPLAVG